MLIVSGCGDDDDAGGGEEADGENVTLQQEPEAAADPSREDFPDARGRTMQEVASEARSGSKMAPASSLYLPGRNRLAFGVLNEQNQFIYGPTAVYIGRTPQSPARGPFLAPSDSLITEPAFRSEQAATEEDAIASVYAADVSLPKPGDYALLALTRIDGQLLGATGQLQVSADSPVPAVGERPPAIETDTLAKAGDISEIDTRQPPDDMHFTDFADVVGERPVALLFATPQLCQSRVCGPVTDIAAQLKRDYGDEMEFIHQEVYVDNDPNKGLRPPLETFDLPSEPWLFTFDEQGRVAARLEGSFGLTAFEEAVQAAL